MLVSEIGIRLCYAFKPSSLIATPKNLRRFVTKSQEYHRAYHRCARFGFRIEAGDKSKIVKYGRPPHYRATSKSKLDFVTLGLINVGLASSNDLLRREVEAFKSSQF